MMKSFFYLLLLLLSLVVIDAGLDYESSFYDKEEDPIPQRELLWKVKFNFTMEGADLDQCGPQTKKIILARIVSGIDTYGTRYIQSNFGGVGEIALVPGSVLRKKNLMFGNLYTFDNNGLTKEGLIALSESVSGSLTRALARLMAEAYRNSGENPTCIGTGFKDIFVIFKFIKEVEHKIE